MVFTSLYSDTRVPVDSYPSSTLKRSYTSVSHLHCTPHKRRSDPYSNHWTQVYEPTRPHHKTSLSSQHKVTVRSASSLLSSSTTSLSPSKSCRTSKSTAKLRNGQTDNHTDGVKQSKHRQDTNGIGAARQAAAELAARVVFLDDTITRFREANRLFALENEWLRRRLDAVAGTTVAAAASISSTRPSLSCSEAAAPSGSKQNDASEDENGYRDCRVRGTRRHSSSSSSSNKWSSRQQHNMLPQNQAAESAPSSSSGRKTHSKSTRCVDSAGEVTVLRRQLSRLSAEVDHWKRRYMSMRSRMENAEAELQRWRRWWTFTAERKS